MGLSDASATSEQQANASISQQYYGQCNFVCSETMNDIVIDLSNSVLNGGITISQQCSVDGHCSMNANLNAYSSIYLKAKNSAQATDAGNWWSGFAGNITVSNADSYQNINQYLAQTVSQTCNMNSSNDMNNVLIFAQNSDLNGGIVISQSGEANGSCDLNASMTATAYATGQVQNTASSGKKGDKNLIGTILIVAVVFLIISGVVIGIKSATGTKGKTGQANIGQ